MAEFGCLIVILIFTVLHAFFAGVETGVISIHRMRLRHFVRQGEHGSKLLSEFLEDSDRLLGTTLVGTNISVVIISVVSASMAIRILGDWGETFSTVAISVLVLVFGEYLPKTWFRNKPLERSRKFVGQLRFAELVFLPISKVIIILTRCIVPGPKESFSKPVPFVTIEDLKLLAQEGERGGILSPEERVMINRVFELSDKTAGEIMIPTEEIVQVEESMKISDFFALARDSRFTRMPIWDPKKKEYLGVINVFHALDLDDKDHAKPVADFSRAPLFIPDDMPVDEIFPKLRRAHQPLCLVTDTNKNVVGMITTEDILDEIVGTL